MRTPQHSLKNMAIAGLVSLGIAACTSDSGGGAGAGGAITPTTSAGGSSGAGGAASGGTSGSGGETSKGGAPGTGGTSVKPATGGATGSGGVASSGGSKGSGGAIDAGLAGSGGNGGVTTGAGGGATGSGGVTGSGGDVPRIDGGLGGSGTGGATGPSGTGGKTTPGTGAGTCTASKNTGKSVSGSGSHKVVVESNSDPGISCGTIYRPADLGGDEKYPIFVWGEGACSRDGSANAAAMGEIASHGYFVVADGPSGGGGNCASISMSTDVVPMAKPLISYIDWAIAENSKPCSAYYQSLDTTKISSDGFSCGGLMSMGTAGDPRMTSFGYTSSGLTSPVASYYKTIHTPVKVLLGGTSDIAYTNGERDYDQMSALGIPIILFSKDLGHGGDLGNKNGGDFTKVNLAWLNWQLKGDTSAAGKGFLVGDTCTFCKDSAWEVKSKNLP
jgi:hypothetical protein